MREVLAGEMSLLGEEKERVGVRGLIRETHERLDFSVSICFTVKRTRKPRPFMASMNC
jgi:hypothetical protein